MDEDYLNSLPANVREYLKTTQIFNVILYIIIYSSLAIQVSFIAMFVYRVIIQKAPNFTSAYFDILILEYTVNLIDVILLHAGSITNYPNNWAISYMSEWYLYRFYAFCNLVLVVNRFTGVFCFNKHSQIWSGHWFKLIFLLTIGFPFLIAGYTLGSVGLCFSEKTRPKCGEIFGTNEKFPTIIIISNMVCAIAALAIGLATALARKIRGNKWQRKHKYETYLLIQAIITTLILIFYEVLNIVRATSPRSSPTPGFDFGWNVRQYLLITSVGILKQIFHVSSIILLFIISKSVRESFLSFYHLNHLLCFMRHRTNIIATISTSNPHHHLNVTQRSERYSVS